MRVELENAENILSFLSDGAVKGVEVEGDVITVRIEMPEEANANPIERLKRQVLNKAILNNVKLRFLGFSHGILRVQARNALLALPLQFGRFRERFQAILDRFSRDRHVHIQDDVIDVDVNALIREKTGLEGDLVKEIALKGETISIRF